MLEFWALTSKGVEELLAEEIRQHQGEVVKVTMGVVRFKADLRTAYQLCLWSRLATRILRLLHTEMVNNDSDLYAVANQLTWTELMSVRQSIAIDCVGKHPSIDNTQYGALRVKDAIVDQFRAAEGERPNVDRQQPDVRFQVRISNKAFHFLQDFSGPSLHQRGYRFGQGEAPLKEHLAAALLLRSGWTPGQVLLDPFCGSGTLLIEAALMATHQAPGLQREHFAFEGWPGHRAALWQELITAAKAERQELTGIQFYGLDKNASVLQKARHNARNAGVDELIDFQQADATKLSAAVTQTTGVIVTNPPYGERLGDLPELIPLYSNFSVGLKQHYQGWRLGIITSNKDLLRALKLSRSKSYQFSNGPLDCEFSLFDLTEKQVQSRSDAPSLFFSESSSFGNRLLKNRKQLQKWVKKEGLSCYRLYDADIPEYNVAVDWYDGEVVVHEYAPPASVDEAIAQKRLFDVVNQVPQVLNIDPDKMVLKVRERQKGSRQYQALEKAGQYKEVTEYGARLWVNLRDYLDTGLFLDHRLTRQRIKQLAKGKDVLNLFAYTGTASVHAALGGASSVTTVDMSNTYLDWAKRNFMLNGLHGHHYHFEQADCLQWLARCEGKYDLIFVDPPTFSNSKRMQDSWDVQRDHVKLLDMLKYRLADGGVVIFSNNKRRFKIDSEALQATGWQVKDISAATLPEDFKRNPHIHVCFELTR
ncbi:bifunctional 23S rRNA (guanine(2069)-N(7))-methyltransferase RlmK/23S rRNA (guanine(2445)-N(2))-methyltransferase RlmL [Alkalimonas collagenimarina]|uniref:Ribosomal RNA large subunit methyltransferase K/L n=1 Tax=Alkalimonas collagenimarina TaxID=400390 RepID=A0ABT9GW10_9GAMM|nr:bifunctional 23S rRNA (guanine(2069)-N(7))-methyltransferase RlmK/23S rRNA (guanine(2445)-N(2))-methyltransferase RlmL [Alkalimonas collagenimarina]MDP4535251.1 bifunctional 23S rRNA (guanine(2069)-N(7))-methyltransferase RlmK/23S rRNA (guanine(2445)-N(2))-methyltransferase RlmL [Alkalimonas collagenimarina]